MEGVRKREGETAGRGGGGRDFPSVGVMVCGIQVDLVTQVSQITFVTMKHACLEIRLSCGGEEDPLAGALPCGGGQGMTAATGMARWQNGFNPAARRARRSSPLTFSNQHPN